MLAGLNHQNVLRFYAVAVDEAGGGGRGGRGGGVEACTAATPPPPLAGAHKKAHHRAPIVGILTEHCAGGSLAAHLKQPEGREAGPSSGAGGPPSSPASASSPTTPPPGTLPLAVRAGLALGAARGLAYLHAMRVVHLDLKPENLLLDAGLDVAAAMVALRRRRGGGVCASEKAGVGATPPALLALAGALPTVKVADFGLARVRWAANGRYVAPLAHLQGTLPFMAPELVADPGHVSDRADVWSLGVVMWQLATRAAPHAGLGPSAIVAGLMATGAGGSGGGAPPFTPGPLPAWVEPAWRDLVEACWEPLPAERPSAAQVAARLEALLEAEVVRERMAAGGAGGGG